MSGLGRSGWLFGGRTGQELADKSQGRVRIDSLDAVEFPEQFGEGLVMSPAGDHPKTVHQATLAAGDNGINLGAECAGVAIIRGKYRSGVVRAFWPSLGIGNVATRASTGDSAPANDFGEQADTTGATRMSTFGIRE